MFNPLEMSKRFVKRSGCCSLLVIGAIHLGAVQSQEKSANELARAAESRFPGPTETGYLLPNGWHITPAGRQIETTDLLLNIIPLKDSKLALIATSGFNEHNIALVNLETGSFLAKRSRAHV